MSRDMSLLWSRQPINIPLLRSEDKAPDSPARCHKLLNIQLFVEQKLVQRHHPILQQRISFTLERQLHLVSVRQRYPALFAIVGKIFGELQPGSLLGRGNFGTVHCWCMELLLIFSSDVLKSLCVKVHFDIQISARSWLIFEHVGLSSI